MRKIKTKNNQKSKSIFFKFQKNDKVIDKSRQENNFAILMYSVQIIFEIIAVMMSISLISEHYLNLGPRLISLISGFFFATAALIGVIMLISMPNRKSKNYKMHIAAYTFLLIALVCIIISIRVPLLGVIGYTTTFILIPLQIGLVIFGHFHWKKRKGFPKAVSLTIYISAIFWCVWYLITSILYPFLLIYIKRPSLEKSREEVLVAIDVMNKKLNKTFKRQDDWKSEWSVELKKSNATFKIDDKLTNIYEWAPKSDQIHKQDNLVLFVHGLNGTRYTAMRYMEMFYKDIKEPASKKGYKILSFDMRGFGANSELERTYALKEADDLNEAFKAIIKEYSPKNLIIYGISNGAATTMSFATKWQSTIKNSKTNVKLIEESGYTSAKDELEAMTEQFNIPHQLTLPQAFPLYRMLTGTFWGSRNYLDEINKVEQPLLIIHGGKDHIVPFSMGTRLLKKRNQGKYKKKTSSIFIEQAGHVKVGREFLKEFVDGTNKFLTKNI